MKYLKIVIRTECPHCGCKDLKQIGVQQGIRSDLQLANCANKECSMIGGTIVMAKFVKSYEPPKLVKIPEDS